MPHPHQFGRILSFAILLTHFNLKAEQTSCSSLMFVAQAKNTAVYDAAKVSDISEVRHVTSGYLSLINILLSGKISPFSERLRNAAISKGNGAQISPLVYLEAMPETHRNERLALIFNIGVFNLP